MSNRIGLVCVMGGCGFSPNPDADTSVLPFPPPVCSPRAPSALPQYDIGDLYAVIVSPSSERVCSRPVGS